MVKVLCPRSSLTVLNERLTNLPKIIVNSLKKFLRQEGRNENLSIHPDAFSLLLNYHYAGNYRELEGILRNAARTAYLSARLIILPEDLKRMKASRDMSKDIPYVELINKLGRDIKL